MKLEIQKPTGQVAFPCFTLVALASHWLIGAVNAQTFTTIKSFGLSNVTGFNPRSELVQGPDGTLYGTTFDGEGNVKGSVFKVQPDGSGFTVLKWFTNPLEGEKPVAGVTLAGSVLYGTAGGGTSDFGTVFRVNTDGSGYTVIHHFTFSNGAYPYATLTLSGGTLYGTTYLGGSFGHGSVFKVNTNGTGYKVLKHFASTDGQQPCAGLTLSGGVLYGTTFTGGSSGGGTVFKVNTDGTGYTILKDFNALTGNDGTGPFAGLTLSGSTLYGTTTGRGSSGYGTIFKLNTDGTGYTVLKGFTYSDGWYPQSRLTLSGGALLGTTHFGGGGNLGCGTVFKLNTEGTGYTVLKRFTGTDGRNPLGATLSGTTLYGTTSYGGSFELGTVYKLDLSIPVGIQSLGHGLVLNWTDPAFLLQAAPAVIGVYTNVPGASSPYTNSATGPQQFFRLKLD